VTEQILADRGLEIHIAVWKLIPAKGGIFVFEVNGETLFSKKELGRHAEDGEIRALLLAYLERVGITYVPAERD